jgi:hypothetical protein
MRAIAMWSAVALLAAAIPALAQQPTQAQVATIKQACRSDYQSVCSGVPTGGSAALQCLQSNAASVSPPCQQALSAISGGNSASTTAPSTGVASAPMSTPSPTPSYQPAPPQMSRRQQMMALRADCGSDFRRFCYGIQPGGGRAIACLYAHGPELSQACQGALQGR